MKTRKYKTNSVGTAMRLCPFLYRKRVFIRLGSLVCTRCSKCSGYDTTKMTISCEQTLIARIKEFF